jgi:hypothetical protein
MHPGDSLFCLVSFEGPDDYARAGGLAEHISALVGGLAARGYETHLVYFGDPRLPGVQRVTEHVTLHRWAQWLSAGCPGGVYQAEDARREDLAASLPGYLLANMVRPMVRARFTPVIVAAEWQTLHFLQAFDRLARAEGLRPNVTLGWELATPSLGRIDWSVVPEGVRLLGRDLAVVQAGAAAGRLVLPLDEGAGALLAALGGESEQPATGPPRRGSGSTRAVARRPAGARSRT